MAVSASASAVQLALPPAAAAERGTEAYCARVFATASFRAAIAISDSILSAVTVLTRSAAITHGCRRTQSCAAAAAAGSYSPPCAARAEHGSSAPVRAKQPTKPITNIPESEAMCALGRERMPLRPWESAPSSLPRAKAPSGVHAWGRRGSERNGPPRGVALLFHTAWYGTVSCLPIHCGDCYRSVSPHALQPPLQLGASRRWCGNLRPHPAGSRGRLASGQPGA